jgi:hypothetical protein
MVISPNDGKVLYIKTQNYTRVKSLMESEAIIHIRERNTIEGKLLREKLPWGDSL